MNDIQPMNPADSMVSDVMQTVNDVAKVTARAVNTFTKNEPASKIMKGVNGKIGDRRTIDYTRDAEYEIQLNVGYVTARLVNNVIEVHRARDVLDSESYTYVVDHDDFVMQDHLKGFSFPTGVVTVLGTSDASKSPLASFLAQGNTIEFGEPLPGLISRAAEAATELMSFLIDSKEKVISFDSVKNLLSRTSSGGAAATRGVSRAIFPMLSDWSSVAASLGKTIIVPVNISTGKEDALEEIKEAMRSNVSMHIFASGDRRFSYLSRIPGRGKRVAGTFSVRFTGSKVTSLTASGPQAGGQSADDSQQPMMDDVSFNPSIPLSLINRFINKE